MTRGRAQTEVAGSEDSRVFSGSLNNLKMGMGAVSRHYRVHCLTHKEQLSSSTERSYD